jgi:hypothetical protein
MWRCINISMRCADDDVDVVKQDHQTMKLVVIQYSTVMKLCGKFHEEQVRG